MQWILLELKPCLDDWVQELCGPMPRLWRLGTKRSWNFLILSWKSHGKILEFKRFRRSTNPVNHSQIQDFVVEHVVRTECVLPASLQSTYKPSTSVGTLPQNSKFPTTWWPPCGRNLIEIYHIVNFKVTPEWHWSRLLGTLCGSDLCRVIPCQNRKGVHHTSWILL